jgi:hypothetical protein
MANILKALVEMYIFIPNCMEEGYYLFFKAEFLFLSLANIATYSISTAGPHTICPYCSCFSAGSGQTINRGKNLGK